VTEPTVEARRYPRGVTEEPTRTNFCRSLGPEGPYGTWVCVLSDGHDGLHIGPADVEWTTAEETGKLPEDEARGFVLPE
jgi:hypothetical protein